VVIRPSDNDADCAQPSSGEFVFVCGLSPTVRSELQALGLWDAGNNHGLLAARCTLIAHHSHSEYVVATSFQAPQQLSSSRSWSPEFPIQFLHAYTYNHHPHLWQYPGSLRRNPLHDHSHCASGHTSQGPRPSSTRFVVLSPLRALERIGYTRTIHSS
jgi:hypothetical protein